MCYLCIVLCWACDANILALGVSLLHCLFSFDISRCIHLAFVAPFVGNVWVRPEFQPSILQVEDNTIMSPMVEVNQSGPLMETMVDITPKDPLLAPSVGHLTDWQRVLNSHSIKQEGLILCDRQNERTARRKLRCTGRNIYPSWKRYWGNWCSEKLEASRKGCIDNGKNTTSPFTGTFF